MPLLDSANVRIGEQGYRNLVLPSESADEAVRRYILARCSRALRETTPHRTWLLEAAKRYEAIRSTRSLDHDDPVQPWHWASNVGIPVEQITGESIVPRFAAATVDSEPIYRVEIAMDDKEIRQGEDLLTKFYQELFTRWVKLRRVRKETFINLAVDGDGIEGVEWEEVWQQTARTQAVFEDSQGNLLADDQGNPQVFRANLSPEAYPADPSTGRPMRKLLVQQKDTKKVYEGPRVRSWRVSECIWPEDSASPDIQEQEFFGVQMWKSISWLKTREGDPIQGKLKNVQNLVDRYRKGIPPEFDTDSERSLTQGMRFPRSNKILLWLVFAKFDVDSDGIDEEIVALVAPRERVLLGWRLSSFVKRPYFHYQLFKMPGRFTGRGLPHVLKGLRDMIDFLANSTNNRINLYQDPPIGYEINSGFDPDIHLFGTGATWGPLAEGGLNRIKIMETPQLQELVVQKFIDFYLSMVQRLTSITDLNLGGPTDSAIPNVKTATGTQAVLAEGQVHFSDFIREFQEISEEEAEFIDQEMMPQATPEILALMSSVQVIPALFQLPKRLRATGNSTTMNRQNVQQLALFVFDRFVQDPVFNADPKLTVWLRQQLVSAFDMNIQLPQPEEIQKLEQQKLAGAIMSLKPEQQAQLLQSIAQTQNSQGGNGAGVQPLGPQIPQG